MRAKGITRRKARASGLHQFFRGFDQTCPGADVPRGRQMRHRQSSGQVVAASASTDTHAPLWMKSSAAAAWPVSFRVMRRTRTLVSTACMPLTNALPYPLFHFIECVSERLLLREQHPVDVLGGISATAPHHDLIAVFVPFEDGTWTNAKYPANLGRDRYLSLRCNLGVSQCHRLHHHGNGAKPNRRAGSPRKQIELFRMSCAGTSGIVST